MHMIGRLTVAAWCVACLSAASDRSAMAQGTELQPGKVVLVGTYPSKTRREGRKARTYYLAGKQKEFRLRAGGPSSVVLLVRGVRPGRVQLGFKMDTGESGEVRLYLGRKRSRGVYLRIPAGTHLVTMRGTQPVLIRPLRVKRGPRKQETQVAWREPVKKPEPTEPQPPPLPPLAAEPGRENAATPPATRADEPVPKPHRRAAPTRMLPPAAVRAGHPPTTAPHEATGEKADKVTEKVLPPPPPPDDPAGPTTFGQRGLYHTWAATPYAPGSMVLGAALGFFKASDFLVSGDEHQRLVSRVSLAGSPVEGLEINAGFSLAMDDNSHVRFEPGSAQSIGDPFLGIRYGIGLTDWFALGAGVQSVFPSGKGFSQLSTKGISTRILFAFDFTPIPGLLLALNAGYHFDNSRFIFEHSINEFQGFAAGVNPHDQVLAGLGAAYQIGPVAPFLELHTAQAVGADGMGFADSPSLITVGVRAWPLSQHTLHLLATADIGLAGIHPPAGKGRTPPYQVILGAAYHFGVAPPERSLRQVVRYERVEVPVAAPAPGGQETPACTGRIVGKVLDGPSGKPLGNAKVVFSGKRPAILITDPARGDFETCPRKPGPVKLTVHKEGYQPQEKVILVTREPEIPVTVEMQPAAGPAYGRIKGTVRSVAGIPLRALISIPARNLRFRATQGTGEFERKLATGSFDVLISMPGYVTQRRKVTLGAGDVIILNVELYPEK